MLAPWIVNTYVASGIVMAIGLYFTIRYRPYCTLKSPEREIAMELHRKKLMNEPMSIEEEERVKFYLFKTKKYNFGDFFLSTTIPIHVFTGLGLYKISNLYFISIVLMILALWPRGRSGLLYCFVFNYMKNDKSILYNINIYLKGKSGEFLDKFDLNQYENERFDRLYSIFYRYSINTGASLNLILDVLFGSIIIQ